MDDNAERPIWPDLATPWEQLLTPNVQKQMNRAQVALVKQKLWEKYLSCFKPIADKELKGESQCVGGVMKIKYFVIGEKPTDGYPLYICLHGGGGTLTEVNDTQWKQMQGYYRDSVSVGVYVAPRGITDTWNLHFVEKSYELYDKLIAYMILCHSVDPNRVYLLGYSAGGDGVYQITPRMADRWAGANMSAGHPNGVGLVNLYHVPFVIQVGECDSAYNRNKVGAQYGIKLKELMQLHPNGYVSECWIHKGKPHNISDNDKHQNDYLIISNLNAWLKGSPNPSSVKRNTNAIAWLNQHQRNPVPSHLIWDTSTRAQRKPLYSFNGVTAPSDLFYWIDISGGGCNAKCIEATVSNESNKIYVKKESECGSWIRLLLRDPMVDMKHEVVIEIGGETFTVKLKPSLATMTRTLLERGDPNFVFESEVILSKTDSGTVHHERRPCVEQTHVLQSGEWKAKLKHLSRMTLPLPFVSWAAGTCLTEDHLHIPNDHWHKIARVVNCMAEPILNFKAIINIRPHIL